MPAGLEQYRRRLCVRVEEIIVANDKIADKVLKKVENTLKEACLSLSGNVIDWAHRIENNYKSFTTKNTCRSVIIRFTSFKHRTSSYQNRNKLKCVRIKLDQTKKRYNVLKSTRSVADENQDVKYVFADINCRLKIVFKDGTSELFKDISELNELIEKHMP